MLDYHPLISVIVPVYNVDKYLSKCIESIIYQSYEHLEIIIIDDGSNDTSASICDDFALQDQRIKVFHCLNHGVSAARNRGIKEARGEYISFIDSDDFIERDFYESLLHAIDDSKSIVAAAYCGIKRMDDNGVFFSNKKEKRNSKWAIFEKKEAIINCLKARNGFDGYIWNGIYKKNIIPFFDEHKTLSEDLEFSVMALMNIATECVLMMKDSYKYNYRVRTSGSRKLDIHERYKYTIDALANIKKRMDAEKMTEESICNAYYERCMRMDFNLLEKYSTAQRDRKLFLDIRSRLVTDFKNTYKGIKRNIGGVILNIMPENGYKLIFKCLKVFF